MPRYEAFVPPVPGIEKVQQVLGVDDVDQLVVAGLAGLESSTHEQKKWTNQGAVYGYVMPYEHKGKPTFLRAIITGAVPHATAIPSEASALSEHLSEWHHDELQRLQAAGIDSPLHVPIIVTDREAWGGHPILITLAQAIKGKSNQEVIGAAGA